MANEFNDDKRFSVLPAFFIEEALRFFSCCPAEVTQSYESIKTAFCKEFGGISVLCCCIIHGIIAGKQKESLSKNMLGNYNS